MAAQTTTVILLLFSLFSYGLLDLQDSHYSQDSTEYDCRIHCASNLTLSSEGGSDLFCDRECSIEQCRRGCSEYKIAAHEGCQKTCASSYQKTFNSTQRYTATKDEVRNCIQGCFDALEGYYSIVKIDIYDYQVAPQPERMSIGHSSLALLWEKPQAYALEYRVSVKEVDVDTGWHTHSNFTFTHRGEILLTNLHPYVTYKFKVMILVTTLPRHLLETMETVEITTHAHGKPSTAPIITSMISPSPTVISLSWRPPLFTNGKVLSYRIYVQPVGHRRLNLTTIEIPHNATSWLLSQLKSSQAYVISLSARNAEGEGPRTSRNISTPNPGNLSAQETPYLVLGADKSIVKRNILDVLNNAAYSDTILSLTNRTVRGWTVVYKLPRGSLTGVSLHIRRELAVATDSAGDVLLVSLTEGSLLNKNLYPSILGARAVDVDWLGDRVFVASWNRITWQIHSCPLEKDMCVPVIQNIHRPITDIKVDPINGYLFYVVHGEGQGLYRVDLEDINNLLTLNSVSVRSYTDEPAKRLIAQIPDLFTFVLDYSNLHLYLVNDTNRTMMSAFLDGTNMKPFHENNINSAFQHVTSAVLYNETFMWTDKSKMYVEVFDPHTKTYRHNDLLFFNPSYSGISIYHPTAQPIPVPSVAPDKLEVLFTKDQAVIQWKPPPRLQFQGRGAFNNWTYELSVTLVNQPDSSTTMKASNVARQTISKLRPDSEYAVKIRAKSDTGYGPWSNNFIGRTLAEDGLHVLMGIRGGRIVDQKIGDDSYLTAVNFFSSATDIAWYEDMVLYTTEGGSTVTMMNTTNNHRRSLAAAKLATCVSFDWLGQKVYWGESLKAFIHRADIKGVTSNSEFIHQSVARDIAVDSVRGRLYWSTDYTVEMSYLNGDEHEKLFNVTPHGFWGRQVMSLTVDTASSKVLWFVKGYQIQSLYMKQLSFSPDGRLMPSPGYKEIGKFGSIFTFSNLGFFSGKLFWLTEDQSLVVGNANCDFAASVSVFSNVTAFAVKHPLMHRLPNGLTTKSVRVIPDPIRSPNIKTVGDWSKFNLTWPQSTEVNHGTVIYEVAVKVGRDSKHFTTAKNWYEISGLSPYTKLDVSIKPYTVWGYADPTTVSVRSPMSKPTAPLSPEVYIKPYKNATASVQSLAADFRWNSPHLTNGIISHHIVRHWMGTGQSSIEPQEVSISGAARHFILPFLIKSQTYHFDVMVCNDAGCSPPSDTKSATTDALNPIPTLLIASKQGLMVMEMDGRLNSSSVLSDISPEAVTFLSHDPPRVFWMDQRRNFLYEGIKSPFKELTKLNGTGRDVTIDWISRNVYIVEAMSSRESSIMSYNIDQQVYTELVVRPTRIGSIIADPYSSAVMWTETDAGGKGQVMLIDINTKQVRAIFSSAGRSKRSVAKRSTCSCPDTLDVASAIAIDYAAGDGSTRIVFIDNESKAIYSSDIYGCECEQIVALSRLDDLDVAPELLAVDHMQVSCYSKARGKLYSIKKSNKRVNIEHRIPHILDIVAYGSHLQPLPDSACLDPGAYNSSVQQVQTDSTSIDLRLMAATRPEACRKISTPVDKYTIYHRQVVRTNTGTDDFNCQADISACSKQESYSTHVTLSDLQPYSQYVVQVAVSNYYTDYLSVQMGRPIIISTKIGVPSNVRDLLATPVTPVKVKVIWNPPIIANGPWEQLTYTVKYSTVTSKGSEHKEWHYDEMARDNMTLALDNLRPNHMYNISIQTCPINKALCNTSRPYQVKTYSTPGPIQFVSSTHNSIQIKWKSPDEDSINRCGVIIAEVTPGELIWDTIEAFEDRIKPNNEFTENITHLEPNTLYAFGLNAIYEARPYALYYWPSRSEPVFKFRTNTSVPDQPLAPSVTHMDSGAYEVSWEQPDDNGDPIDDYVLQYRDTDESKWKVAYHGPKERWMVEEAKLDHGHTYLFRVTAINGQGRGPFSKNSTLFLATYGKALEGSFTNEVTIGIIVGSVVLLGLFVVVIVLVLRKRFVKIKTHQFIIRGPDTELATLRELPHTTFQQSNTLYAISIQCTDEEIAKLPHFSRCQLVLHTFLGSGAFGEVFEGVAKNILGDESGETKCAVKTLRKSASDQEKQEFLKEALLMKNFQHEHILSLLGVCLDNDPQFIIMELMEGGDLLSFIRSCRATSTTPAKLMLPELVKICVHVARGCKYLEDMHFVHRDLAARNCLVSSKSPSNMVVKIGDFGLARDIYKNDYYRKEGEGLLPVRWMSPESLVDGFFTTQSDIWAFGVMMWEVITLGQQPYPARTNIDVLHHVRGGGKLERPEKCADEMYSLMRKCWSFNAEERPCFADILSTLEQFEDKCLHMTFEEIACLSLLSVDANSELGAWMSEDEEDENEAAAETRGLFTPKCQTITGGGSVRSTQSDKAKRLSDLLGTTDKQVVDLTKIKRKRYHSDSKQYCPLSSSPHHNPDFPAAGNYDHHGYLEPRGSKGGNPQSRYLDLLNYAPELRTLLDTQGKPLVATNGSAFTPVHVTRKGYHPASGSYSLVSHDEEQDEETPYGHIVGKEARGGGRGRGGSGAGIECVDNPNYSSDLAGGGSSTATNDYPIYAEVCDARRHNSTDSSGGRYTDYHYNSPSFNATMTKSPRRKFSDQDLYFSPASYRQYPEADPVTNSSDPRYTSLECNNNNYSHNPNPYPYAHSRTRHASSNSNRSSSHHSESNYAHHHYAKPGQFPPPPPLSSSSSSYNHQEQLCVDLTNYPSSKGGPPSVSSSIGQTNWANNPDDVFLESDPSLLDGPSSSSANHHQAGGYNNNNNNSRIRRQVYPEGPPDFSNYSYGHVSLV